MKVIAPVTTLEDAVSLNVTDFVQSVPAPQVRKIETICCDNCGSPAERHYLLDRQSIRTQCDRCDYLMITCSVTGKVVEAYTSFSCGHRS